MRSFKWLGIGCLLVALLVVGGGFFLPTAWSVEESVLVNAPSPQIHMHVSDLRNWEAWAGHRNADDTTLVITYDGPSTGVGARRTWQGENLGHGTMVITRSHPDSGVWLDVRREGTLETWTSVHYEKTPEGTRVVFRDRGDFGMAPLGGYLVLLLEPALAQHFRTALQILKERAEAGPPPVPADSAEVP